MPFLYFLSLLFLLKSLSLSLTDTQTHARAHKYTHAIFQTDILFEKTPVMTFIPNGNSFFSRVISVLVF